MVGRALSGLLSHQQALPHLPMPPAMLLIFVPTPSAAHLVQTAAAETVFKRQRQHHTEKLFSSQRMTGEPPYDNIEQ